MENKKPIYYNNCDMKYFRIGFCPPNPGWKGSPYNGSVRAFSEDHISEAIDYAKEFPNKPIYVKGNYGAKYQEITFEKLIKYKTGI